MSYCTQADLESACGGAAALIWITDLENTAIDEEAVTSAIEFADGTIDQYATGTPGTGSDAGALWETTPAQAKQCAINVALYVLYDRIRREVPASVEKAFERSMDLLEKLSQGKVSWVTTEPIAAQNNARVYYVTPGSTPRTDNPRRTRRDQFDSF